MSNELGRLTTVPLREVWPHEAYDFTRWLLANPDPLADVLGMQLELRAAEHRVGGFSLDLMGVDLATNRTVIVENQLETSDHSHLGQILTYAGGTNPQTIVWCAPAFREEHRAALDWLNEHTDEDTRFFAVEISAVRIGESAPAPLFTLAVQPNNWSKEIHVGTSSGLVGKRALYAEFWRELAQRIQTHHPDWTRRMTSDGSSWVTLPYGVSGAWYSMLFTRRGPAVELYFGMSDATANREAFDQFAANAHELESMFGGQLTWEPLDGKKACRIRSYRPEGGAVTDDTEREELLSWFLIEFERFRMATQRMRQTLVTERPGQGSAHEEVQG